MSRTRREKKDNSWEYWGRDAHDHWAMRQIGRWSRRLLRKFRRREAKNEILDALKALRAAEQEELDAGMTDEAAHNMSEKP